MALLINAITLPFIILLSLPLFLTALLTTTLALSTLLIRASVVYVESVTIHPPSIPSTHTKQSRLFLALLQAALHPIIPRSSPKRPPPASASASPIQRAPRPPPPSSQTLPVRD